MTTNQPQRYGGLLGAAGGVLALIGGGTMMTLGFMPDANEAVQSFTDDTSRILGGGQLLVIGAVLIAAFGAVVHKRIQAVASDSALSTAALSGYILTALAAALGAVGYLSGALRAQENGVITDAEAATLADLSSVTLGAVAPAALALAVGATSLAGLRFHGIVPRWLAWGGVPIAIGLVILPINYAVMPLGMLWTIVAGVGFSSPGAKVVDVTAERVHATTAA